MTALEVAQRFSARKIGRDKWIALCPAHPDRKPSLTISSGKTGVLLACMSRQCPFLDIVHAAGLKPLMLRYDYDPHTKQDAELIRQWREKSRLESLYQREKRMQDLKTWKTALECKQKPVRIKTRFECDIDAFCSRLSR